MRLAVVAAAAVVIAGLVWATHAPAVRQLVPLPTAEAIGPGVGIKVGFADGSETTGCTAGFLVHTDTGQPGLLSAGHCNKPGGPGAVSVRHGGIYPTVGTFTETRYSGSDWDHVDIGLITLDDPDKIPLTPQVDGRAVAGLAGRVAIGDTLCHLGIRSGEPVCGPVTRGDDNKVRFAATDNCGDSGGPVYRVRPDGAVDAVGVLLGAADGADPAQTCAAANEYSVAQLIKPWLTAWELTLVTAAP